MVECAGEAGLRGGAPDEVAAHVRPAERKGHHAAVQPRQLLVDAVAVADDHRAGAQFAEQRRLGKLLFSEFP